jgi:single-strand DNA-binding protein
MKNSKRTGKVFCTFRLAVDGPYRGPDAPKETDFFNIVAFGNTAQALLKHLAKGAYISIRGELKNRSWIDNIGNKRTENVIVVREYNIHEWLKKSKQFESLADSNGDLLIPREITDSLFKQIDARDEDIPDFNERDIDDLF